MKSNFSAFSFMILFVLSAFNCKKGEELTTPVNSELLEVLELVNEIRANGCKCGSKNMPAVEPLVWNDLLHRSASGHAQYMDRVNILSHTGQNRSSMADRIDAVGYNWMTLGENIAMGYTNAEQVVDGWIKSVTHCKGIMNGEFKETGIARSGNYWCQDFGGR